MTFPFKEPIRTVIHEKTSKSIVAQLTDRQKEVLRILQDGPLKIPQIKDKLSVLVTDRVIQIELSKLKSMGLIKSSGKTKATTWYLG